MSVIPSGRPSCPSFSLYFRPSFCHSIHPSVSPLVRRNKTAGVNDASSSHCFFFHFLKNFSIFSLSLLPLILVAPSSLSLLPPGCSFLLVPPSSLLLFPVCPSFFLVYHLEFLKVPKHPFFTKFDESATDRPTDGRTNGRTRPLIEMRGRI